MFIKSKLKKAECGDEVDAIFRKHKIFDLKKRIELIWKCMGEPEIFITIKDESEEELRSYYLTLCSMFITGSWKY